MARSKKKLSNRSKKSSSSKKKKQPAKKKSVIRKEKYPHRPAGKEKKLPAKKVYPQTKVQKEEDKLQQKKVQPKPIEVKKEPYQPAPSQKNYVRTKAFKEFEKKILRKTSAKNQEQARKYLNEQYNVKGKDIESVIKRARSKFSQDDFDQNRTYKSFKKKFLRKTDADYLKEINEFWEQQYKKGVSSRQIRKDATNRFVYDTRNRFYKSKKPYIGKTAFKKNKKGEWMGGKPKKRYMWRDKLTGRWIKGKNVFKSLLKALEPFHVRNYMQKHKIKDYQKARKKYLKEIKNKTLGEIVQLYGIYLH